MKSINKGFFQKFFSDLGTMLFGILLLVLIIPGLQWLDRSSIFNSMETATPSSIAIAVIVALIAVNFLFFLLARLRVFSNRSLLMLYVMLSISVPFCSLGLVRPFYSAISIVATNHLDRRENVVKKAYDFQNPRYFPKINEEGYQEYLYLQNLPETAEEDIENRKARQFEILLPLKKFMTGIYVDPKEVARFQNPELGSIDRLKAAFDSIPWEIWRNLLIRWSIFFILILLGTVCLTQVFYNDWVNRENLSFPLAQLPLAIFRTNPSSKGRKEDQSTGKETTIIFRNAFFWGGAVFAILLLLFGGMAHYNLINLNMEGAVTLQRIDFSAIFVKEPWTHIKENMLFLTPLFIGIALLVHQEILRGVVLIFLAIQFIAMLAGMSETGISEMIGQTWRGNKMPFYLEMGTGAAVVFSLYLLWQSRKAFSYKALSDAKRKDAYFPPKWTGICLFLSVLGIIVLMIDLGVSSAEAIFLILFVLFWVFLGAIVVGRARAEAGLPTANAYYISHLIGQYTGAVSTHGLGNLTLFSGFSFLPLSTFPGLIGTQIESLYLAKKLKVSPRLIAVSVIVAFLAAISIGLLSYLTLSYWHGSQNLQHWAYEWHFLVPLWSMFQYGDTNFAHTPTQFIRLAMVIVGIVIMVIMLFVRNRFPRMSIPPICFVMVCLGLYWKPEATGVVGSWDPLYINFIWGPMLIAYVIKSVILKYGGLDLYGRSIPLALGLIFGHMIMLFIWNVYHALASPEALTIFTGIISYSN